jgi:single-strand DNA-binding protein
MGSLNRVYLLGRLTHDPELRHTPKGIAVVEIGLAISRTWTDAGEKREETTFVEVVLWARLAGIAQQYLRKGSKVFIEGRLQLDSWEDKQTAQKRSRLRVVGENLQLLDDRPRAPQPAASQVAPSSASPRGVIAPDMNEPASSQNTSTSAPRRSPSNPHLHVDEPF